MLAFRGIIAVACLGFAANCYTETKSEGRVLGVWYDAEILNCNISIEERAGKYLQVIRDCKSSPAEVIEDPLLKIGPGRFKLADRPRSSWHYSIATSGGLEVRDSQGVVRSMESTTPKTYKQAVAQRRSSGVSIGMTAAQVLESKWGRPTKVNTTATANTVREQWVYGGGYLYFENGVLTAVQK